MRQNCCKTKAWLEHFKPGQQQHVYPPNFLQSRYYILGMRITFINSFVEKPMQSYDSLALYGLHALINNEDHTRNRIHSMQACILLYSISASQLHVHAQRTFLCFHVMVNRKDHTRDRRRQLYCTHVITRTPRPWFLHHNITQNSCTQDNENAHIKIATTWTSSLLKQTQHACMSASLFRWWTTQRCARVGQQWGPYTQ